MYLACPTMISFLAISVRCIPQRIKNDDERMMISLGPLSLSLATKVARGVLDISSGGGSARPLTP